MCHNLFEVSCLCLAIYWIIFWCVEYLILLWEHPYDWSPLHSIAHTLEVMCPAVFFQLTQHLKLSFICLQFWIYKMGRELKFQSENKLRCNRKVRTGPYFTWNNLLQFKNLSINFIQHYYINFSVFIIPAFFKNWYTPIWCHL